MNKFDTTRKRQREKEKEGGQVEIGEFKLITKKITYWLIAKNEEITYNNWLHCCKLFQYYKYIYI